MGLFDRLFGKKPMDASGTPLTSDMKALLASAKEASWTMQEEAAKLREAIKKTWGVDCQVLNLSEEQATALSQQAPLDGNFRDIDEEYLIRVSSNAIVIRAHGAFVDFGYAMFLYRNKVYYVNVEPIINLVTSIYKRTDELSHMAKIMIVLNKQISSQRKSVLVRLEGNLKQ